MSEQTIKGDAVAQLIGAVNDMMGRGAPVQFDSLGFNKTDYNSAHIHSILSYPESNMTEIPISLASNVLRILAKYKNTQLQNYDAVYQGISELINAKLNPGVQVTDDKKVLFLGKNQWGKLLLYIKALGRGQKKIQNAVQDDMASKGDQGKAWQMFSYSSKDGVDVYQASLKYLNVVAPMLKEMGYDVSDIEDLLKQPTKQGPAEKQKIARVEYDKGRLLIALGVWSDSWNEFIKTLQSEGIHKVLYNNDKKDHARIFIDPDPSVIKRMIQTLQGDFDTSPIWDLMDKILFDSAETHLGLPPEKKEPQKENALVQLKVRDITKETNGSWHMAFSFYNKKAEPKASVNLKDIIKFMFPRHSTGEGDGDRVVAVVPDVSAPYDPSNMEDPNTPYTGESFFHRVRKDRRPDGYKEYLVRGDYNTYKQLAGGGGKRGIFEANGFDSANFNKIVAGLVTTNVVPVTRVEGDLDGFQKEKVFIDARGEKRTTKINDHEAFLAALDDYKKTIVKDGEEIDFELYDKQKEGVAFLYGRQSALLGDSTGVGKTVQTIVAADLRIKKDGGNVLIITLNPQLQTQWINSIVQFATVEPNDVSTDAGRAAKWNVLTYTNFSVKSQRDEAVRQLKAQVSQGNISVLILDEIHKIKTGGSQRTANIQSLSSFEENGETFGIPFVWGASATVVANTPTDLYNQLKVINHPLGKLTPATFAKELGGMKYGGTKATVEDKVRAANKLKEWLMATGVYMARTKKDVRGDIPDMNVEDVEVNIDTSSLYRCIGNKVMDYKKPELTVSVMIATRNCLAIAKVPHSLQQAEQVLSQGKKVMVFTAFRDSAIELQVGLQSILDRQQGGGQVVAIMGGMHKKTKAKIIEDFKDMKGQGGARAMVLMIQAGGTGLDFPNIVEDVIENDFDWTPESVEQMRGRAYRINSQKPVKVTSIVAEGTEDKDFKSRVDNKIKIANIITKLTDEQLKIFEIGIQSPEDEKRLKEIERELVDAVQQQVDLEEEQKIFDTGMANGIMDKVEHMRNIDKYSGSWYGRITNG